MVLWFAGVVFIVLMVIMLMILLLDIGVLGVDDLLADIPLDTTGLGIGRVRELHAAVVPWTLWSILYQLHSARPPSGCVFR